MAGCATDEILVVGAGISGLTAAAEVAGAHSTTVVDRLPVIGGRTLGYDHPAALAAKKLCDGKEVRFLLGATAVRWSQGDGLLVAGPTIGIRLLKARYLVFAGGLRPSTAAELGLVGDRMTGVFSAPYAFHLMASGVQLGKHVVVIGSGLMAAKVARQIVNQRGALTIVSECEEAPRVEFCAGAWWGGWRPHSVCGTTRAAGLEVTRAGVRQTIDCDAIILAEKMRPLRNIDGAIFDSMTDANVLFVQDVPEETSIENHVRNAKRLAQNVSTAVGEVQP